MAQVTVLLATLGVLVACGTTVSPSATPTDPPQARVTAAGLVFDSADIVEADSAYAAELEASSLFVRGWRTDFSRHTVPLGRYE